MYYIGVDEAGRGPMLGPLVVAAITIPENDLKILQELNIIDSKKLNAKKRKDAFEQINFLCKEKKWKIETTICNAIDIDFAMDTTNLNTLETELFAKTINNLKIDENYSGKLILDACDINEKRFGNRVSNLIKKLNLNNWEIISQHKADENHIIVSAASIIAKVTRDNIIDKLKNDLGIELGSGYPSDPKSKSALFELCKGEFPNYNLRWNWASIRNFWIKTKGTTPPKRNYEKSGVKENRQSQLSDY